ncbi:MAG TPA: hypothetical protein VF649_04360 [Sphingomonas sp.]
MTETRAVDRAATVEAAARSLLLVRHDGEVSRVALPIFYPSGAAATVEVAQNGPQFLISDAGLAYREAELIGAENLFNRNAAPVAEQFGIDVGKRGFTVSASVDQLAGAMADVAAASVQVAHRICERVAQRSEAAITAHLYERLVAVFGAQKVVPEAEIAGASSHKWRVSALVHVDGKDMAFEAVSNHHSSVYSSATMFHDLSLLERKPVPVAVVKDKASFGAYLSILSQAANVIEDTVPNAALERLAA